VSRPNILVVQADQLTAKVLPMYGGPAVATPHMNRLAERGVTFVNAYCNNPVCAPSRAAMLTGRLSSAVGCYDNAADFPSRRPRRWRTTCAGRATAPACLARCTSRGPSSCTASRSA
jgi:choline-sulfatase